MTDLLQRLAEWLQAQGCDHVEVSPGEGEVYFVGPDGDPYTLALEEM